MAAMTSAENQQFGEISLYASMNFFSEGLGERVFFLGLGEFQSQQGGWSWVGVPYLFDYAPGRFFKAVC